MCYRHYWFLSALVLLGPPTLAQQPAGEAKLPKFASVAGHDLMLVEEARLIGHTDIVRTIDFSADGHWLVSGGDDKTVRVWDASKRKLIHTLTGLSEAVREVAPATCYEVGAGSASISS